MSHQSQRVNFHASLCAAVSALVIVFAMTVVAVPAMQAQTFKVIHSFTGKSDGANPVSNLVMDRAGNLYGTTAGGGRWDFGTVFKMKYVNSGWVLTPLYTFQGGLDGIGPLAGVVIGADGSLYGTTSQGGGSMCSDGFSCGTVYKLKPPPTRPRTPLDPWTETVLYRFSGPDGERPESDLVFDKAGNLYGTTYTGGQPGTCYAGCGVVFELTPSGGAWTETAIHTFLGPDGGYPMSGMIFDTAGNLYGTSSWGGAYSRGTVYELTPSGAGWTLNTPYSFGEDRSHGLDPFAGLLLDNSGNLYGATSTSIVNYEPVSVFELTPSNGTWTLNSLYEMTRSESGSFGPWGRLTMDAAGNLYGTTEGYGAYWAGSVFKLTYSNGSWIPTVLHEFSGVDGQYPQAGVTLDAYGNIYGTAPSGGSGTGANGVVWEITP
jgi:uncharacterized repeat protein (TIGR03803 family)